MNQWPRAQIRRLFRITNGGTPTADPLNWDGDVRWATPVDLAGVDGEFIDETQRRLTVAGLRSGSRTVPAASLILSTRAPIGYVAQTTREMAFNQGCRALVPTADVDLRYFRYQLYALRDELQSRGAGSTFQELSTEALAAMLLTNPDIEAQRAIADFLDAETARIDALIAKKRRMIALLERRWRSAVEHRMVELAANYGSVPLKRLVRCLDGQRIPLSGEERAERQDIYPYYGASGAIDQVDGYLFDEELVLLGEDGAQLADPDYEISFVVRGKCWVNNHAHVLRPLGANADFLALHLSTFDRFAFISGSTREKITQEDMWRITVPAVDFEVQRSEARYLLDLKLRARDLGKMLGDQINLLAEHRQALITAAVTGRIEVPEAAAR